MNGKVPDDVFAVDTSHAPTQQMCNTPDHLDDLLRMCEMYTSCKRELHELEMEAEASQQKHQRKARGVADTAVAIVDELRLLVRDARAGLERAATNEVSAEQPSNWLKRTISWGKPDSPVARPDGADAWQDWLTAFERSVRSAIDRLDQIGMHHVPLIGQDVRVLKYNGRSMKRWISVKNPPSGEKLLVVKEMSGLWVENQGGDVALVQRGEVMVQ